nr:PREDICTED: uncharacterized protein LOC109040909 isoform X1 [Bemisia tabaci]
MNHVVLMLFVFVEDQIFPLVNANWADEQVRNVVDNWDSNNVRLREPFWPGAIAKNTKSSTTLIPHTTDEGEIQTEHHPFVFVPSNSDFAEIRHSKAFVDKTLFLHEWLTQRPNQWYVTAPPGFGKSSLANMAVQFLNASFKIVSGKTRFYSWRDTAAFSLFQGTKISSMKSFFKEHFQNYAVIYLDLAPLSCTTEAFYAKKPTFNQDFHEKFKIVIKNMMSYYPTLHLHEDMPASEIMSFKRYLQEGMDEDVSPSKFWKSTSFLKKLIRKFLKKDVIVIVDSYDALCKPCMIQDVSKVQRPYVGSFMIEFGKMIIQDGKTRVLYLGTFNTAELMLKKPNELRTPQSPMYMIQHTAFSSDEQVAKYFGLSTREVADILAKYSMQDHLSLVNDLLNGHAVLNSSLTLLNTRSVLSYIKNRNVTPSALTSPFTAEILRTFEKLFLNTWISDVLSQCIFQGKAEVMISSQTLLLFGSFLRLKHLLENSQAVVKETAKSEDILTSIRILQFLGLISITEERTDFCVYRVSSRTDAELMNGYLCNSGIVQRDFGISPQDDIAMTAAVRGLAPNNDSIQCFGKAIYNIVKVKPPKAEYQLKSLIYVYSRKVETYYGEDFAMEAGITTLTGNDLKLNEDGKLGNKEKIDIILVLKNKSLGIILTSILNKNATFVMKKMMDHKYLDVFDSDSRFSKLKIKNKLLIGISVSENKSVEISSEMWHQNEKIILKQVILNSASSL